MPSRGSEVRPPMDDTWMMWPDPRARRWGTTAWVTQSAPNTLISIWSRAYSSDTSSTMPNRP